MLLCLCWGIVIARRRQTADEEEEEEAEVAAAEKMEDAITTVSSSKRVPGGEPEVVVNTLLTRDLSAAKRDPTCDSATFALTRGC